MPLLILSCLYSYHMAVQQKQERPFPHATITATACHYPQDIEFRFFLMIAGSFLNVIYFVIFKWTYKLIKETGFPYKMEKWLFPVAQVSVLGLYFATATIDGAGTTAIHGPGAVIYFIVLFICVGYITFILHQVRWWYTPSISIFSMTIKMILFIFILVTAIYCMYLAFTEPSKNDDDPSGVIIEWVLALGSMTWLLTFVLDFKDIFITLRGDFSQTIRIVEQ